MIASATGRITGRDARSIILDVHGVGLRIAVVPSLIEKSTGSDESVTVFTHLHVREDALELYGFVTVAELRLFEKLISVNGVGPRMAMGVMSAAGVADLESAIDRGRAELLTKVSGVGKKTAERIIVELRGKLTDEITDDGGLASVIDALTSLGYSSREAREAGVATPPEQSVEERVKTALKRMGR